MQKDLKKEKQERGMLALSNDEINTIVEMASKLAEAFALTDDYTYACFANRAKLVFGTKLTIRDEPVHEPAMGYDFNQATYTIFMPRTATPEQKIAQLAQILAVLVLKTPIFFDTVDFNHSDVLTTAELRDVRLLAAVELFVQCFGVGQTGCEMSTE